MSRVSDCLPRKLSGKNTKAEDKFGSASDGNKFRVPALNPDGKDRLQKTKETTADIKFTPTKRQLPTKNTDAAGRAATKRRSLIRTSFNKSEGSEFIVQLPGSNVNNTPSDLSATKSTSCMSTESANYVLNDRGDDSDNALKTHAVSEYEQDCLDICDKILPGNEEDNNVPDLNTDDILREINDVLNLFNSINI
jgi:hypothetical protein